MRKRKNTQNPRAKPQPMVAAHQIAIPMASSLGLLKRSAIQLSGRAKIEMETENENPVKRAISVSVTPNEALIGSIRRLGSA